MQLPWLHQYKELRESKIVDELMPLPLPNLDDRTYDALVEEARALIPSLYPAWTDHNPTDPGMILIELFAWLTEMSLYHLNRVPDANYITFLRLLNGADSDQELTGDLDADIRRSVLKLRKRHRAATCTDFEYLATQVWPETETALRLQRESQGRVRRARCLPRRNLATTDSDARAAIAPGHVSLIVVPDQPPDQPRLSEALAKALWTYLDERRLLTMRHHVVGPDYIEVMVTAKLFLQTDALVSVVSGEAAGAIRKFFHPVTGGPDGNGWPFGRAVYLSEVYELLDKTPGVNYVEAVVLTTPDGTARELRRNGDLVGIMLAAHELVEIHVEQASFLIG